MNSFKYMLIILQ